MTSGYPEIFADIDIWARENGVPPTEARRRFAQYAVLRAIASVRSLRETLVFKGGNALDFVWLSNRSTIDLDFSLDPASDLTGTDAAQIRKLLEQGAGATSSLGVMLAVHSVRRNPPGADRDFVTYEARIGYALPDEAPLRIRMAHGQPSPSVIPVEISVNEPICAAATFSVGDQRLRVGTVEDIVAEKLRALLQQPIRNRDRRQDLLDIAVILQEGLAINREQVSDFLLEKASARKVAVSRAAFRNQEVAQRAQVDYAQLEETTRRRFVPFDEAWAMLMAFVDQLEIPEATDPAGTNNG